MHDAFSQEEAAFSRQRSCWSRTVQGNLSAAEAAVGLTNGTYSELHVVHAVSTVVELPYPRSYAKERSDALLEQKKLAGLMLLDEWVGCIEKLGGSVAASYYREGKPEDEVVLLAEDIDAGLVVIGDRVRGWIARMFGESFSENVLRRTNRPVLVVREPPVRERTASDRQ
jgi:nucleotide-binding universal stress UspA family protein